MTRVPSVWLETHLTLPVALPVPCCSKSPPLAPVKPPETMTGEEEAARVLGFSTAGEEMRLGAAARGGGGRSDAGTAGAL